MDANSTATSSMLQEGILHGRPILKQVHAFGHVDRVLRHLAQNVPHMFLRHSLASPALAAN